MSLNVVRDTRKAHSHSFAFWIPCAWSGEVSFLLEALWLKKVRTLSLWTITSLDRMLTRIAHEIVENNDSIENVALVGIISPWRGFGFSSCGKDFEFYRI